MIRLPAGAAGLAPALLVVLACAAPEREPGLDPRPLQAVAEEVLPDPRDSALIVRLDDQTMLLEHHPQALSEPISPGSVLKLVTAYALAGSGREDAEHDCTGTHRDRFGVERSCWLRPGHGRMRLRTALAASCNAWFYAEAEARGAQAIQRALHGFGLDRGGARLPVSWPAADVPDLAIGDHAALALSPRALLRLVSVIASRGRDTALDPARLELLALGMEEASRSGTLAGVFPEGLVAAKSGTAKRSPERGMRGIVLGYLPRREPRWAFVVVKDRGRGAVDAGPAAAALVRALAEAGK